MPVIPIVGARKLSRLQDDLASFDWALSAEQVKALDEASQIDPGFPFHLYAKRQVRHVEFFAGPACGLVAALELLREVIKTPLRSKALGR